MEKKEIINALAARFAHVDGLDLVIIRMALEEAFVAGVKAQAEAAKKIIAEAMRTPPGPSAIEVITKHYEFAHGRNPKGRGSWAFEIGNDNSMTGTFWHNGNYGEARKAALAEARKRGAVTITVLS